jgi:chromosome partitioning protein
MNVVVLASRKGGSGKSTLTAHLAAEAARPSRPTLLIDADPQGSLSLWHGLRDGDNPALKRATRGVDEALRAAKRDGYAWVFVDTPPYKSAGVADAIRAATIVIIPTRPSLFDIDSVRDTIALCRELKKPYMAVINAAPPKRVDAEAASVALAREQLSTTGAPVWSGQITQRTDFSAAVECGEGAKAFDPESLAAAEIARLWRAVERSARAIDAARQHARGASRNAA